MGATFGSSAKADANGTADQTQPRAPTWDNHTRGMAIPDGCRRRVVHAVLEMGAKVAREGIGEKTPAKGMLFVVGDAARLMDGTLGNCGNPKLNKFRDGALEVTVFDFLSDKEVRTEVLPCFGMDKAMVICGATGRILANKWGIANIAKGDDSAGTKLQVRWVNRWAVLLRACQRIHA